MTPRALLDLATDALNNAPLLGRPSVLLVVPREHAPTGRAIRLFGRSGPVGRIANVKRAEAGFDVVAYFDAAAIVRALGDLVGVEARA